MQTIYAVLKILGITMAIALVLAGILLLSFASRTETLLDRLLNRLFPN